MKRSPFLVFILALILAQPLMAFQEPSSPEDTGYIILLREPSVAEMALQWSPSSRPSETRRQFQSARADVYRKELARQQEETISSWRRSFPQRASGSEPGLQILHREIELLNCLLVKASAKQLEQLRSDPRVEYVVSNARRFPLMDSAPDLLNAAVLWDLVGGIEQAGDGIRIGIVDSGINVGHPMFQDTELSAPAGFPQPAEFAAFTNSKVIVARNFVLTQFGLNPQGVNDPRDETGHGSRVAGAAAGHTVETSFGVASGIAPKAYLGNYKVFGNPNSNGSTTTMAIIAAITRAIEDQMDVINLSLGGPARNPATDPEQQLIANASALGTVFVIAAGNTGEDGPSSVTSPGTSPAAITVGATSHQRFFGAILELDSADPDFPEELQNVGYLPGTGAPITASVGPFELVSIERLDPSEEGCSPLPLNSLVGRVALVRRGTCLFTAKAANVLGSTNGNAAGMVVYNHLAGPPIIMNFGQMPPARPAVGITRNSCLALRNALAGGVSIGLTFQPQDDLVSSPSQADILAEFSGRGPNIDRSIKPDLSAPGVTIVSASNVGAQFLTSNGTSFATPMVSGAAALLMQLHPDWSTAQIKSALVNSAQMSVTTDGLRPARVMDTGSGRLDLAAAAQTSLTSDPVSLTFGLLDEPGTTSESRDFELRNTAGETTQLDLDIVEAVSLPGVRLSLSSEMMTLGPGEAATIRLDVEVQPLPEAGAFEGWVRVRSTSGETSRLPYWGTLAIERGALLRVAQSGEGEFTGLHEALQAAFPGDIIEITDSETYPGNFQIGTLSNGVLLHGLTVRAATGQTPVFEGDASAPSVFTVDGARGVTLQGLTIHGAQLGIRLNNASAIVRDNHFSNQSADAIRLEESEGHLFGNTISNAGRGIGLFSMSSALVQQNQIHGAGLQAEGIFISPGSVVSLLENHISESGPANNGQAIRVSGATVLVKGNYLENSQGELGDGVLIRGGAEAHLQDNWLANNDRYGISIFQGSDAFLLRNEVHGSGLAGLRVLDSDARVEANQFLSGATGALIENSNLLFGDSIVAASASGHGIEAENSSLQIWNATLSGNSGYGLAMNNSAATLSNSIFFNNLTGDLDGDSTSEIDSSLLQDSPRVGSDGNYSGDPLFSDTSVFDFSLGAGSPAIDRGPAELGNNAVDLRGHQRRTDGDGDGIARIDTGAVESASPFAPSLQAPILSTGEGEFTGLALANAYRPGSLLAPSAAGEEATGATVRLRRYRAGGGSSAATIERDVPTGAQLAELATDLFGPGGREPGWIEVQPPQPDLVSFTLAGRSDLRYLDGADLSPATHDRLVLPEIQRADGAETWIYVVNPHDLAQTIRISWIDDGSVIQQVERPLAARALLEERVSVLFPAATSGFLLIEGDSSLMAMELFGDNEKRAGLAGLVVNDIAIESFAAHLVSSPVVETHLNLVNPGPATEVTVIARDEAGRVLDNVTINIGANEHFSGAVREIFTFGAPAVEGWLSVLSLSGQVRGNIRFGDPQGRFEAALPLQSQGAREFLFGQVAVSPRIFTGIALVNLASRNAQVSLEVFSSTGERTGVHLFQMGPREKIAALLTELIPSIQQQLGGYIRIRSNQKLAGFEIFGDQGLEFFSAVPPQVIVH